MDELFYPRTLLSSTQMAIRPGHIVHYIPTQKVDPEFDASRKWVVDDYDFDGWVPIFTEGPFIYTWARPEELRYVSDMD